MRIYSTSGSANAIADSAAAARELLHLQGTRRAAIAGAPIAATLLGGPSFGSLGCRTSQHVRCDGAPGPTSLRPSRDATRARCVSQRKPPREKSGVHTGKPEAMASGTLTTSAALAARLSAAESLLADLQARDPPNGLSGRGSSPRHLPSLPDAGLESRRDPSQGRAAAAATASEDRARRE